VRSCCCCCGCCCCCLETSCSCSLDEVKSHVQFITCASNTCRQEWVLHRRECTLFNASSHTLTAQHVKQPFGLFRSARGGTQQHSQWLQAPTSAGRQGNGTTQSYHSPIKFDRRITSARRPLLHQEHHVIGVHSGQTSSPWQPARARQRFRRSKQTSLNLHLLSAATFNSKWALSNRSNSASSV
jgi:hypothetical protein